MNPQQTIERLFSGYLVPFKSYHQPLPAELQPWYCYTVDGGHSIACAIKSLYKANAHPDSFLVPVPVKSVLRGYQQQDGFILVDLPYDRNVGLVTPLGDDEF